MRRTVLLLLVSLTLPGFSATSGNAAPWFVNNPYEAMLAQYTPPAQPPGRSPDQFAPPIVPAQAPNGPVPLPPINNYDTSAPPQNGAPGQDNAPLPATQLVQPKVQNSEFAPAQIVAIVGDQHILAGDIDGIVNLMMELNYNKMTPEERELHKEDLEKQRQALFRQQLQSEIQTKQVFLDFVRMVPKDKLKGVQEKVSAGFEKDLEEMREKIAKTKPEDLGEVIKRDPGLGRVAMVMHQANAVTQGELDQELRKHGSSLVKAKRAFFEQKAGQNMIFKSIKQDQEVTHEQMLDYYREHAADYAIPAKARYEQLTARFVKFADQKATFQAIASMGNEVYLGGTPFGAVAKKSSQEPNADQGGFHEWTSKGSLKSKQLDEAIFTLPLNKLSQIIEDDRGYHILRVLDRQEATSTPFKDAQVEIKEKIKNERRQRDIKQYLVKISTSVSVWTIFDEDKKKDELVADRPSDRPLLPR